MSRFLYGKTEKCVVAGCGKDAKHHGGIVLKSRDAVQAGFCEHHWFFIQCPNSFGIKDCYGLYNKEMGLLPIKKKLNKLS